MAASVRGPVHSAGKVSGREQPRRRQPPWTDGPVRHDPAMSRRVLVVDDDDLLREVAQAALELVGGWQVITAPSGAQAQEQARREHPDAILLDVMMPGLDGPTTVRALRADPDTRDIPIIFLTAKKAAGDVGEWKSLELAGVISKPFDPMTLAADMSALLGWQEVTT
jgi:CheY-like chemotaxis protein